MTVNERCVSRGRAGVVLDLYVVLGISTTEFASGGKPTRVEACGLCSLADFDLFRNIKFIAHFVLAAVSSLCEN